MIRKLRISNFKPMRAQVELDLKPLTVLAGLNSSGKSSVIQSMLLLAQTSMNTNKEKALVLNGNIIQLGSFESVLNENAVVREIQLGFEITPPKAGPARRRPRSQVSEPHFATIADGIKAIAVDAWLSLRHRQMKSCPE